MVSRLLSHYWTATDPVEVRQAQIEDWLDDLREFGPLVVEEACRRWRRQPGGKRPTPGDIRTLCIEEVKVYRTGQVRLPKSEVQHQERSQTSFDEDEIRRARATLDTFARSRGYDHFDAYLDDGGTHLEAAKAIMSWPRLDHPGYPVAAQ